MLGDVVYGWLVWGLYEGGFELDGEVVFLDLYVGVDLYVVVFGDEEEGE